MKKYPVKNCLKYFAGTIALSGIMLIGACSSDQNTADELYAPETETVNREVTTEEYREEEVAPAENTQQNQHVTASRSAYARSSVNIDRLLNEYPEVNEAIRTTLSSMTKEEIGNEGYTMEEGGID